MRTAWKKNKLEGGEGATEKKVKEESLNTVWDRQNYKQKKHQNSKLI